MPKTEPSAAVQTENAIQDRSLHDKERLLRLGLASLALTFMQARGETSLEHLSDLVVRRLITPREFRILAHHMDKAPGQICWCWIAHMFTVAVRASASIFWSALGHGFVRNFLRMCSCDRQLNAGSGNRSSGGCTLDV
eukprot:COSAG02_NODE_3353_length_6884_cov_2.929108_4_plen_138_part_00